MSPLLLPKYLQIAERLEAQIGSGRWENRKLPSMRWIAREYKVSVVTASRALQVLRDKRLINTVDRSGSYLMRPEETATERWALCLNVTPGSWYRAVGSQIRTGFEVAARRQGQGVATEVFTRDGGLTEADFLRQARAARDAGIGGVFLLPARLSELLARQDEFLLRACRSVGLPVVLIERNLRGHDRPLEYDLVACDDVRGAAICTRHLLDQGRRRVAFVASSPTSSHNDRIAGYLYTLYRAGGGLVPFVVEQTEGLSDKAAYQDLADRLLAHGADGVVCYHDYAAIGLILEFLTRGVRVPRDVALTGFDDLPLGNAFAIGVTSIVYPAEDMARHAFRVMRERVKSPAEPPVKVVVPGRLIVRESSTVAARVNGTVR